MHPQPDSADVSRAGSTPFPQILAMSEPLPSQMRRLDFKEREDVEASLKIARRTSPGVEGKVVVVRSNFYEIAGLPSGEITHYDVLISPSEPRLHRSVFEALVRDFKDSEFGSACIVYDGMVNVYASRPLPNNVYTLDVDIAEPRDENSKPSPPRIFNVRLKKVAAVNMALLKLFIQGQLDYTPYEAFQALEVILRHTPLKSEMMHIGRSFYSPKNSFRLSGAIEAWLGFFFSARGAPGKVLLNVDTSATCFYRPGTLVDFVQCVLAGGDRGRPLAHLGNHEISKVERAVRGVFVKTQHAVKRKYRIKGLTKMAADKTLFDYNGVQVSVASYFEKQYNLRLKYPSLPCIVTGAKERQTFIPMEVCDIVPAQRYPKKLSEMQTADMIKVTCQKPDVRLAKIQNGLAELNMLHNPILDAFGIRIQPELVKVDARVLPPPTVRYSPSGHSTSEKPLEGAWNLRDKKVLKSATLEHWAVLNLSRSSQKEIEGFVTELVRTSIETGLVITSQCPEISSGPPDIGGFERLLRQAYESAKGPGGIAQLVLVILPAKEAHTYAEVKRVTDCIIGRPSQCIVSRNVAQPKKQYCANVAIKMNVKLGGVNSTLGDQLPFIFSKPTIVFGADVSHPGPGDRSNRPSMAAVVASMDPDMSRYASVVRTQDAKQEVISNLQEIVKSLMIAFNQINNKIKPVRILFYRDGLSEGQFSHSLNVEVAAIRKACEELEPGYCPKITFVVIQKRHHVRFFPVDRANADRSGNLLPGTVIDTKVTHPIFRDFFLQSHAGIQGTSRPSHYHVILDENGLSSDEIHSLTYRLCYTYARCTRSVSVVPPAYYAHLVAFRARMHYKPEDAISFASSVSEGPAGLMMDVHPYLTRQMYFA